MAEATSLAQTVTSAANTAVVMTFDIRAQTQMIAISMATSAGTATVKMEVSTDSAYVNAITLETIAAAGATNKMYFNSTGTVGATIALSPLAFPYIRITIGAAGGGNTTTTSVAIK